MGERKAEVVGFLMGQTMSIAPLSAADVWLDGYRISFPPRLTRFNYTTVEDYSILFHITGNYSNLLETHIRRNLN